MNHTAHTNMVKQQVRTWAVTDPVIVNLLETIPREHFVPAEYQSMAYAEFSIPLGNDQFMLLPSVIGRMLQSLNIKGTDKICQIGTGSGYTTAMLARLGHHVYSVDCHKEFNQKAQQKCSALGINNVTFLEGDGTKGWAEFAPYDVMVITGSMPFLPKSITEQIAANGRIFVVLGEAAPMHATLFTQSAAQQWQAEKLFETSLAPLENAPATEAFVF